MAVSTRCGLLVLALLVPLPSQALLLGTHTFRMGEPVDDHENVQGASSTILLCVGPYGECDASNASLLFAVPLSSADAGSTLIADRTTDLAFDEKTAFLTNGVSDSMFVGFGSFGNFGVENGLFYPMIGGPNSIDFAGFTIDSLEFELSDDFSVTPDFVTDHTILRGSYRLQVFGTVIPEPATGILIGAGLVSLVSFVRRLSARSRR